MSLRSIYLSAIAASERIAADPSERAGIRQAAEETAEWYREQVERMAPAAACRSCGSYPAAEGSVLCTGCGDAHEDGEPVASAYAA